MIYLDGYHHQIKLKDGYLHKIKLKDGNLHQIRCKVQQMPSLLEAKRLHSTLCRFAKQTAESVQILNKYLRNTKKDSGNIFAHTRKDTNRQIILRRNKYIRITVEFSSKKKHLKCIEMQ